MTQLRIRRAYAPPLSREGQPVLVDRLWPRDLRKQALAGVIWMKEVAPSPDLRKWFDHRPEHFAKFARLYRAELEARPEALAPLRALSRRRNVTLLYAARDEAHNHARILADYLGRKA